MNKKISGLLAAAIVAVNMPQSTFAASSEPVDISGHWAAREIKEAVAEGWVNGYENHTFQPENKVTRAEFVKMITAATHLSPDSETSKFLLKAASDDTANQTTLLDVQNHWISTLAWFKPALAFGLVEPSDYGSNFIPDRPITRQEIAVMTDRALGLVYQTRHDSGAALPFTDTIPDWAKGYIRQAVNANVIKGYEDGSFGWDRPATRAEAVVMVNRALSQMKAGSDDSIKVFVTNTDSISSQTRELHQVQLPVPAQYIDGRVYVPVRSIFDTADQQIYKTTPNYISYRWRPAQQSLFVSWGVDYSFQSGNQQYFWYTIDNLQLTAKPKIVNGELMIPAYDASESGVSHLWNAEWNTASKTLILHVGYPQRPIS